MAKKPWLDPDDVVRRVSAHLPARDLALLDLLVRLEGGNRSGAAKRAITLYCERVEQLRDLTESPAK